MRPHMLTENITDYTPNQPFNQKSPLKLPKREKYEKYKSRDHTNLSEMH